MEENKIVISKKHLRLFRQYCRVFCGTLFMYITLGTISHLLKFSSILSSVFLVEKASYIGAYSKGIFIRHFEAPKTTII